MSILTGVRKSFGLHKPAVVAAGGGPSSLAFVTSSDLADGDVVASGVDRTFSSVPLGTASAVRKIIACVGTRNLGGTPADLNSVTINGVSATLVAARTTSNVNSTSVEMWVASVPTGTTGDVVVNHDQETLRAGIGLFEMTGGDNGSGALGDTGTDPSISLVIGTDEIAVYAGCGVGGGGDPFDWAGAASPTEEFEINVENAIHVNGATSNTAGTNACTINYTATESAMCGAVFGAA